MADPNRKIPYNYTSADDKRIITHLFGSETYQIVQKLEKTKRSGRSSRLLFRVMGDLFLFERNAFLFQELIDDPDQFKSLLKSIESDLSYLKDHAEDAKVLVVYHACKEKLNQVKTRIQKIKSDQRKIQNHLAPILGKENIYFDPFNRNAHATDATDWRLFLPIGILRPESEFQVVKLIKAVQKLGYHVIPRGAGTGLTGGATPLTDSCIMVNTEKLNKISEIDVQVDATGQKRASIELEAGVITQEAIEYARSSGYIFATDPTSAWACTIGGNLAENAGGKTAVLHGTAIDNLLSYNIVMPDGELLTIERVDHPYRKIFPEDQVKYNVYDSGGELIQNIELTGNQIRRPGLGKDVTNKALNGLPGIQKEGCDGIITSARFVLYPEFQYKKTVCIEFFGSDMTQAGQVIAKITKHFTAPDPALIALEHFDKEYVNAIKYKAKTSKGSTIIAVLLIDIVSNNSENIQTAIEDIQELLSGYDRTGFVVAKDTQQSERFWQDRKRLGAIAAHTNAFKLNEDIVLPIDSLARFASFIDQYNVEEKKINQRQIIDDLILALKQVSSVPDRELFQKRVGQVKHVAFQIKQKLDRASKDAIEAGIHSKNFLSEAINRLQGYIDVVSLLKTTYEQTQSRLIVIATHMHAGDGNVHVNIPVLSNDRQMMKRAELAADRVMEKAVELDGVVSGEHGIGVTKFKHLGKDRVDALAEYRKKVDPSGLMNPNKLSDRAVIDSLFTTSFSLLEVEARILQFGSLTELASKIANCVRCGRCKPKCPVFYPARNMFYHPRNKNLALISLIEALLYVTQRQKSASFNLIKKIEQIADHCTLCHRCYDKCPVNIDSGVLSIDERNLLSKMGFKSKPVATNMILNLLGSKRKIENRLLRMLLLNMGSTLQRGMHKIATPIIRDKKVKWPMSLLKTPVRRPDIFSLNHFLPENEPDHAYEISITDNSLGTVFYFPGCGSERVFASISLASLFILLENRFRVILPPPFLCCGYPFQVNARKEQYETITLENTILFARIREMLTDLDFDACVVSCGTCMESLEKINATEIFKSDIKDVTGFLVDQGIKIDLGKNYYYHEPCHDSLKKDAKGLFKKLSPDSTIKSVPYCCSEAGTMALSRPDISEAMLDRKKNAFQKVSEKEAKVLTNCPSCIQGLGRMEKTGVSPIHLTVELARQSGGKGWKEKLKSYLKQATQVPF